MKATRRHELEHNVLDSELAKTFDLLRKHGSKILWAIVILGAIGLAIYWYATSRSRETADIMTQYAALTSSGPVDESKLSRFKPLIEQKRVPRIAALACVDLGDIYAVQALSAGGEDRRQAEIQAESYYRRAIADHADQAVAVARAYYGLGKLAEGRGDFDAARQGYQAVLDMQGTLPGFPVIHMAAVAMKQVEAFASASPVRMASTMPATQPASMPADQAETQAAPASQPADPAGATGE